jgi:hypothetical protein
MGFLSDTEIEFEAEDQDVNTPPPSPRLAATHAQTIAENFRAVPSEFSEYFNASIFN